MLRVRFLMLFVPLILAVATGLRADKATDQPKATPRTIASFQLRDPRDGSLIDTAKWKNQKAIVVAFLGTECPINNEYMPELAQMYRDYNPKKIAFVAVNSNSQDTPAKVAAHAKKYAAPFPVVKDPGNKIADLFGAKKTPEVFVLNGAGKVLYQGRIDDQFGLLHRRPGKPNRRDLVIALDEILAGKAVSVASTEVAGCYIGRVKPTRADGKTTFTKHISRILQKQCQECHRPGQIGPMSLMDYDDVVAWAETIQDVIDEGRMPPWHADPKHGKWSNERILSKEEKQTIRTWIKEGMPRGDDKDMPAPKKYPTDWQIGKPDVVFKMPRSFSVPAETPKGGVPYKYFSVNTDFKEDKWIQRAEARPGAPEVVHHIIIFIVPPGQFLRPDAPGAVLAGMAPGDMPLMLKPGFAKKVPAGSRLVFQMHYTPNGKAVEDSSSVGIIFSKQPVKHRVYTKPVHNRWFLGKVISIPPGAENHELEADYTFKDNVHLMAFMPHMHLRGKDFRYEAHTPDGKKEILLSVPNYNFNWQSVYRPVQPIALKKGTRLRCVAHYDNSSKNPNNPDPTKRIFWGDQTWEEMMVGWIDYYIDEEKP